MKSKNKFISLFLSVVLICCIAAGAGTLAAGDPAMTVKLNGTAVIDISEAIQVDNRDRLEVRLDFSQTAQGETYAISLPEIFVRLDQATIESGNVAILPYADFTLLYDPSARTQRIVIVFKESVMAASFSFVGTLDFTGDFTEKAVTVDSAGTIKLKHESAPVGPGVNFGTRPSPPSFAPEDFLLKTASNSHITDRQLMEDAAIGNSFYYTLRLNYGLFGTACTGTLRDELPTGMQLFIPNAPGISAAYQDDYQQAYRSFDVTAYSSAIQRDSNGYYMDVPSNYLANVNRVEGKQGRDNAYAPGDLALRLNISQSIAERLDNGEGALVSYGSLYVGYRLEADGKIHFYAINSYTGSGDGQGAPYEQIRTDPWSDAANARCVPLYTTADGSPGSVQSRTPFTTQTVQSGSTGNLLSSFTREHLGQTVSPDGTVTNQWRYIYNGREEFALAVTKEPGGRDMFEVKMNALDENSFFYGKSFTIRPHIYFDRSKWKIPSSAVLTFGNTASYGAIEKEAFSDYTYNFGSAGTVVAGAKKTVDGAKKSYMNPETDRELTYAVEFRKSGPLNIPAGNFNVSDVLDGSLDFVAGSIRIYRRPDSVSAWTDVSADITGTSTQTSGSPDNLNLKAAYETVGEISRIAMTNTGSMSVSAATEIKVEFKAGLKSETKYGTKISNYFGETVETFVDHKIAVHKVDQDGNGIGAPAVFALRYTADPDYENGALRDLQLLSTGNTGTASALYRPDADVFYLRLTEESPPAHYSGIDEPIWIKASRDAVSGEMRCTLEKAPAGVLLAVAPDGLVEITVPNTYTPTDIPPTTEPPTTEPPTTVPPTTVQPTTEPLTTEPPTTVPPTTVPPTTEPPTTVPPTTEPPTTVPPTTVPPTTEPPTTAPPTAAPPKIAPAPPAPALPTPRRSMSRPNAPTADNAVPVTRTSGAAAKNESSAPSESTPSESAPRERAPKTGENRAVPILLFMLIVASAAGVIVCKRRGNDDGLIKG